MIFVPVNYQRGTWHEKFCWLYTPFLLEWQTSIKESKLSYRLLATWLDAVKIFATSANDPMYFQKKTPQAIDLMILILQVVPSIKKIKFFFHLISLSIKWISYSQIFCLREELNKVLHFFLKSSMCTRKLSIISDSTASADVSEK